jgi:hypothetical protein
MVIIRPEILANHRYRQNRGLPAFGCDLPGSGGGLRDEGGACSEGAVCKLLIINYLTFT